MIEQSELYRKLVDASTDGLWLLDGDGRTVLCNPRMAELLGRTPEQMEGLSAYDVHDPAGKKQFGAHMERARAGDPGHNDLETMYLRLDGTPIWLLGSFRPIHDDHGATVGYLHRFSDYTDLRRRIESLMDREKVMADAQALTGIGSWEWDVVRDQTTWSDQLYSTYGLDRDFEANFEGYLSRIHPEDRDRVRAVVSTVFEGADGFEFAARIIRGDDGRMRWCHSLGQVAKDESGQPVRVVGTNQDVTDRVLAEQGVAEYTQRLGLLRRVAETGNQSTELVGTLTGAASWLSLMPGWKLVAVFTSEDDGELTPLAVPDHGLSWDQSPDTGLAARARASRQFEHTPVGGREQSHSLVAVPILHGSAVAAVIELVGDEAPPCEVTRDLFAQVATQLGRVAERERAGVELADARDQAMEASRLKSEFLATMSHEIRTPMNGVIGLTDLLMRTALDDKQRLLAQALHGSGSTLRGILNDVLDLSKIEAGKLELDLVDFEVRSVVEQTVRLLQAQADDRGLDLRLTVAPEVPRYVRGDAVRWEQVLSNLGSNAVKFTDHGSVEVAVDLIERTADGVLIEVVVHDTGAGIPLAAQQRLFDAFTQADPSTTRRHGGSGLGLAIAKQLVAALGGELGLTSEVGRGTTFRFTARFGNAAETARPRPTPWVGTVPVVPDAPRVLVVEDNQVNQMVAVGLLDIAGYATEVAADGVEAVTALEGDHGFAAVLMDCRMPRMDGYTATRAIRADEAAGRRVPIIAMTASALEGERERCLDSGMDDFLTKPVDSARLHGVLRQWISGSAAGDAPPTTAPAVASAEPDERGQIVDVSRIEMLHEMVKEGVSLFQRSSGNFIAHAQDHLTAIGTAVERGDAEELMASAHKLKGSALNLGLPRVGAAAFELEEQGRGGLLDGATASYGALSREIGLAITALEHERAARA